MRTRRRAAQFLRSLASETNELNLKANYILMGEAIQPAFPPPSPLWAEYEALGKRLPSDAPVVRGSQVLSDFKVLAETASRYLNQFEPTLPVGGLGQQEITLLVDRSYFQSGLFTTTKWLLAVSLALIGAGSLGYAGLNIVIWDKVQAAQERADAATKNLNDIRDKAEKLQSDALKQINDLVSAKSSEINAAFASALKDASSKLDQDEKVAAGKMEAAVLKSTGDLNATVASQSQVVAAAATKATQDIARDLQDKLQLIDQAAQSGTTSLSNRTEQKKTSLDQALQKSIDELEAALKDKLLALNQKSIETGKRLDAIASDGETAETQFASQLKQRLASWDQGIGPELARVDTLAKSVTDMKSSADALDRQLAALQKSSAAALDVATKLSAGTATGDLQWIGAVLENSAALIVLSLVLSILSLGFSGAILICQLRHRRPADTQRHAAVE
jgi:hypothetical protein